jgi:hypothetical protein
MLVNELLDQLTDGAYSTWHMTPTPWTVPDIKIYYDACQHDTKMKHLLEMRCQLHQTENWITAYDDLQLQRDTVRGEKQYVVLHLFDQLRKQLPADELEETLFMLLSIYRLKLALATPEDDSREVLLRIDMINRHFAFKFMQAIESEQPDYSSFTMTLKNLGALTHEILPWLSVRLRETIFDEELSDTRANRLIYSALRFYRAIRLSLENKSSLDASTRQSLSGERLTWTAIDNEKNPQKAWCRWVSYFKNPVLSPLILTRIKERAVGMLLCEDSKYHKQAVLVFAMLHRVSHISSSELKHLVSCGRGRFLPLSAGKFYDLWVSSPEEVVALIQDYAATVPDVLKESIIFIFSDKRYLASHLQLIKAEIHPALTQKQYPLYMFRTHHQPQSGDGFTYQKTSIKTTFAIEPDEDATTLVNSDRLCRV